MEYRHVGRSGLLVSVAGLGTNNFGTSLDHQESTRLIRAAIDLGVTFFDTADSYGADGASEHILGEALRASRDEVVIATKFGTPLGDSPFSGGASRRHVVRAVEGSLRRLRTDWIDLYQLHLPDPQTPIDETLAALDDLVHAGKVRYIGASNLAGWQVSEADWIARSNGLTRFVSAQNEWNLLDLRNERELVPACRHLGVGVIPYHPLASGMLTGKYRRSSVPPVGTRLATWPTADNLLTSANFASVERLTALASAHGHTVAELALAWLAAHPEVCSVPVGASTVEQLRANVAAFEWKIDTPLAYEAVHASRGDLAFRHSEGPPPPE
jgi:aryl-alcohol dehydrogenase-like predicted oxidoreductase